ncbi:MAG: thioredoxin family protein [Proteobacteria bacterium]|nr:thioredoxin family protein [Pseudomonadota bacterium]
MMKRVWLPLFAAVLGLMTIAPIYSAWAALTWPPYTAEAFAAAQDEGRTIAVVVHADWCTTCRAQEPALNEVMLMPEFAGYAYFRVDYDLQKDVMAELDVPQRSTVLIFKGKEEVGRLFAENSPEAIRNLFSFGLD